MGGINTTNTYFSPSAIPGTTLGPNPSTIAKMQKLVQLQGFENGVLKFTYTFLINPETYQQQETVRAQVLQTLGGGYADLFGPALVQISMSGTTGLQQQVINGAVRDGYERFQDLANFIRWMWSSPVNYQANDYHFYLYNWTDDQFYEVLPLSFNWTQAVPRQLVFYYALTMVALRETKEPANTAPYAIRQWFTSQPAQSAVYEAQVSLRQASLAYEMMQNGSTIGVPALGTALILQYGGSYLPYLAPSDYPAEEYYPGIGALLPSISSYISGYVFPITNTVASGGTIPFAVNYGYIQAAVTQGQALVNQINSLATVPMIFATNLADAVYALQNLLLYPEAFNP